MRQSHRMRKQRLPGTLTIMSGIKVYSTTVVLANPRILIDTTVYVSSNYKFINVKSAEHQLVHPLIVASINTMKIKANKVLYKQ